MAKTTNITGEAAAAIRLAAEGHLNLDGATRRPDGSWDVDLGAGTIDRLEEIRAAGETISDTIIRLVSTSGRKPN